MAPVTLEEAMDVIDGLLSFGQPLGRFQPEWKRHFDRGCDLLGRYQQTPTPQPAPISDSASGVCHGCGGTGSVDSGGFTEDMRPIDIPCPYCSPASGGDEFEAAVDKAIADWGDKPIAEAIPLTEERLRAYCESKGEDFDDLCEQAGRALPEKLPGWTPTASGGASDSGGVDLSGDAILLLAGRTKAMTAGGQIATAEVARYCQRDDEYCWSIEGASGTYTTFASGKAAHNRIEVDGVDPRDIIRLLPGNGGGT